MLANKNRAFHTTFELFRPQTIEGIKNIVLPQSHIYLLLPSSIQGLIFQLKILSSHTSYIKWEKLYERHSIRVLKLLMDCKKQK